MIGAFDVQLTQKLAKECKKSTKKRNDDILKEYCLLTEVSVNDASKRFCKEIKNVYPRVFGNRTNIQSVDLKISFTLSIVR